MQNGKYRLTPLAGFLALLNLYALLLLLCVSGNVKVESGITIAIATTTAVMGWLISVRLKTKVDIEISASKEIIIALESYSSALRKFYYGMVDNYSLEALAPSPLPSRFWMNAANGYLTRLANDFIAIRETHIRFREVLEANEMALIELENYYEYIKFKHDDLIKLYFQKKEEFEIKLSNMNSLITFNNAVEVFVKLDDKPPNTEFVVAMAEQLVYCIDLKKIVLNRFQSKIFGGRTLNTRVPLDQSYKTLEQVATDDIIASLREQRDSEFVTYKVSNTNDK